MSLEEKHWAEASTAIQIVHGSAIGGYLGAAIGLNPALSSDVAQAQEANVVAVVFATSLFAMCVIAFGNRLARDKFISAGFYFLLSAFVIWPVAISAEKVGISQTIIVGILISWLVLTLFEASTVIPSRLYLLFAGKRK